MVHAGPCVRGRLAHGLVSPAHAAAMRTARMTKFAKTGILSSVSTMNVSLPVELKSFVDERVQRDGYGSNSEYVRELIRRDQDRQHLRHLLLDGASSAPGPTADDAYFAALRGRVRPST